MSKPKWRHLETYLLQIENHFKRKGYKYLGEGAFRSVYLESSKSVIKIPFNDEGISCNFIEDLMYRQYNQNGILAECSIFFFKGVPLLRMEYVAHWRETSIPKYKLPKWAKKIDKIQVGLNRKGNLVCYDYGHNWDVILGHKLNINLTSKGW